MRVRLIQERWKTYSNLSLNRLRATTRSTIIMAIMMSTSRHTAASGRPIIISLRMAWMYHLAGMMLGSGLSTIGRFSSGNTMPESIIMGRSKSMADTSSATACEVAMVEMRSPKVKERIK